MAKQQTTAQVIVDLLTEELSQQSVVNFDHYRTMRLDPTIALARDYAVAPILASTWTVEAKTVDEEKRQFIEQQIMPLRQMLLRVSLLAEIDFGWKAFEKTFVYDKATGRTTIGKIKPLKNDITRVRYAIKDGSFQGLSSQDLYTGFKYWLDAPHSLFVNFDDEGLGNYALPKLARAEAAFKAWNDVSEVAGRYDKKMAGTYLVVKYPIGEMLYTKDGVGDPKMTDNAVIANDIIKVMRSSGAVAVPLDVERFLNDLSKVNETWSIAFLDPQAQQSSFIDRQKYLDILKVRALGITERAILEGTYGTKAEATAHASATLLCLMLKHEQLTEFFNWHIVNQLLRVNWDEEDTVRLVAQPLTDDRYELFKVLLAGMQADPGAAPELYKAIDLEQVLHAMKLPVEETGVGYAYEKMPSPDEETGDDAITIQGFDGYDADPVWFSRSATDLVGDHARINAVIGATQQRLVRAEQRSAAAASRVAKHKQTLQLAVKKRNTLNAVKT